MPSFFKKTYISQGLMLIFILSFAAALFGGTKKGKDHSGREIFLKTGVFEYKFLDGNTINCTIASDGPYADYRRTNNSGMEWPKGTGKTPVFTAGLWTAGIHQPTGQIRTAVEDYQTEFQPGPLLETFNTTTNDDALPVGRAGDNRYRLYKINKSDTTSTDYLEWPGDLGAPFIDVNGNGVWDAGTDKPKFIGDQQIWCVVNDVNNSRHSNTGTTSPMGLEKQILYFVFNQPGALGNMMFLKWKIINKSDAAYDSVYVGMWSDVDLGDANDDLPGCDTTLSLGYVYNEDSDDGTTHGYGSKPPADGFDFFQGPIVPAGPNDSALVDGKWRIGFRNLPATSFVVYTNGTFPQIVDPPLGDAAFPLVAYDYLQGKAGTIHQYLTDPFTGGRMLFFFSGDPVAGTGNLPSNFPLGSFAGQDVRIMINSGPFTLAQGDTQEIVGAFVIAQGSDRLNSITLLKQIDKVAQDAFNDNFNIPSAPPLPTIRVSELPNSIVFDWSEGSAITESYNFRNNEFQGYNLYQGVSLSGPWQRIVTYDKVDTVGIINDYVVDPVTGNPYLQPVAFGSNSGVRHYFVVDKDYLTGGPLINGKRYYFALTTYSFNTTPDALNLGLRLALESAANAIIVTPKEPAIGTIIPTFSGQVLPTSRPGDDAFTPQVVDPKALTGDTYQVRFNGTGLNVSSWDLIRQRASGPDTVVRASTNFLGDGTSPLMDGVLFKIVNPQPGPRRDNQSPRGWRYDPPANRWIYGQHTIAMQAMDAGSSSGGISYPISGVSLGDLGSRGTKVTRDSLLKVEIRFSNSVRQKAYRYLRNVSSLPPRPAADPSFVPWIKQRGPGFVYQNDYDSLYSRVPFTVWEVDSTDGDLTPRQLNVGFLENNDSLYSSTGVVFLGRGKIDGKWEPTIASNGGLEALYIFRSTYSDSALIRYTRSPRNPANPINLNAEQDSIDILNIVWVHKHDSTKTFKEGDKLTISPNYSLSTTRQFSVVTSAVSSGNVELMKQEMAKINVFPNPYFGHNKAEANPFNRFVTFTHLPNVAKIRVFTITGELVKTIDHNNTTTFERWDLRNEKGLPVASGVYIVHIEIPNAGNRILKLAIIQPEERPTRI